MSVIKNFQTQANKGTWVTAAKCNAGDILIVATVPSIDNQSFPGKVYLVMDVKLERTGETMKLRLSSAAVNNLVSAFSDNEASWVGKRIRVAGKMNYAGLGKEGLIFVPA
jgi:hypothetical protein